MFVYELSGCGFELSQNTNSTEIQKNVFFKRTGRKCGLLQTCIEQNDDHTQIIREIQFFVAPLKQKKIKVNNT